MPSDFTRVRNILARERELGHTFAEAWRRALDSVESGETRDVLVSTHAAWRDGYERRESKTRALA